jgi:hypothetical protein
VSWVRDPDGDPWNLDFVEAIVLREIVEPTEHETHGLFIVMGASEDERVIPILYGTEKECVAAREQIVLKLPMAFTGGSHGPRTTR